MNNSNSNFVDRLNNAADQLEQDDKEIIADAASIAGIGVAALVCPPVAFGCAAMWLTSKVRGK
jgi:hypothetical protein